MAGHYTGARCADSNVVLGHSRRYQLAFLFQLHRRAALRRQITKMRPIQAAPLGLMNGLMKW